VYELGGVDRSESRVGRMAYVCDNGESTTRLPC
jgi:hypothetical protein